ncbi:hypothetical protein FACS1894195_1350 [Bacteroidia bacterium]|nr:hypothetical protein FACS1894195_1350 [Bacteroidia bacterium]
MKKMFEHTQELQTRDEYDRAMNYVKALIDEASENGYLDDPEADNEYVREIGRVGSMCADYEDTKIQFEYLTVRGRSPQKRVRQHTGSAPETLYAHSTLI